MPECEEFMGMRAQGIGAEGSYHLGFPHQNPLLHPQEYPLRQIGLERVTERRWRLKEQGWQGPRVQLFRRGCVCPLVCPLERGELSILGRHLGERTRLKKNYVCKKSANAVQANRKSEGSKEQPRRSLL